MDLETLSPQLECELFEIRDLYSRRLSLDEGLNENTM